MKTFRGYMKNECKKNIIFIIAAVLFIILSANVYNSVKYYKYRRLCAEYRTELNRATNEIELLGRTIEECQNITGSIGELCNRNVKSSRDIIEITEELRAKVYELENCLGSFSQSEYYQYWDSYYHDEQLMD